MLFLLLMLPPPLQEPLDPVAGFVIEARIAAVSSLSQLTQELIGSSSSSSAKQPCPSCAGTAGASAGLAATAAAADGLCQPLVAVQFLEQCVLPALLGALRDYSRDNRGDVGSWVREAAMEGTTQLLLLLSTALPPQQDHQPHSAAAAAAGRGWVAADLSALHSSLAVQLVGHLLQQALERIARLRESALINLQLMLQQPTAAAAVPGAAAIAAALPDNAAELAGVASLACVARLGALLQLPWYRPAVLEGLVASIGGVDASLSKEASSALLAQVGSKQTGSSRDEGTDVEQAQSATAGSADLRGSVAGLLLQLWARETG
jgi:hypothetical protein